MNPAYDLLKAHPFLAGTTPYEISLLGDFASVARFGGGDRIFDEGHDARGFWLICAGRVRLDFLVPAGEPVIVETLGPGTVLGWSWLAPPYRWYFGAQADEATTAVYLDGAGVRDLCDRIPVLGYRLMDGFVQVVVSRLQATRIRLLDVYDGSPR